MTKILETIDVNVPVDVAYDQWTQFETYPRFLDFVESVEQTDDTHTHWKVKSSSGESEYDAVIVEQIPDEVVAWSSEGDENQNGVVTFDVLDDDSTRVTVDLDWQPVGMREEMSAAFGVDEHEVKKDLRKFKAYVEGDSDA